MMLEEGAVRAIQQSAAEAAKAEPRVVTLNGVQFVDRQLHDLRKDEPAPGILEFCTLDGFADFVKSGLEAERKAGCIVHVAEPNRVRLLSGLRPIYNSRWQYAGAAARLPEGFRFEHYYNLERFNILLRSFFEDSSGRDYLLALTATIHTDSGVNMTDDGQTQRVEVKKGITLASRTEIVNPVQLFPMRTFPEVGQPASPFVFRVVDEEKAEAEDRIRCALFETDGGAWKLEAIKAVAEYLRTKDLLIPVLG